MQSIPITTNHYVIKFVSDLLQVGGFPVSSSNKNDHSDITEIVLKVALNTIAHPPKRLDVLLNKINM